MKKKTKSKKKKSLFTIEEIFYYARSRGINKIVVISTFNSPDLCAKYQKAWSEFKISLIFFRRTSAEVDNLIYNMVDLVEGRKHSIYFTELEKGRIMFRKIKKNQVKKALKGEIKKAKKK